MYDIWFWEATFIKENDRKEKLVKKETQWDHDDTNETNAWNPLEDELS